MAILRGRFNASGGEIGYPIFLTILKRAFPDLRYNSLMARQTDIVLFTGLIGGLSYYKTKKGEYFVRRKSGVSRERIMTEPVFARARENITEFRTATLAAKLFRRAFAPFFEHNPDKWVSSRLTGRMVKVIQGDAKHARGRRRVGDGDLSLLEDFQLNKKANLTSVIRPHFTTSVDRTAGTLRIDIPSLIPARQISSPAAATHYRLRSGAAAIDFDNNTFSADFSESEIFPIGEDRHAPFHLTHTLPHASRHPMFLILGFEFLKRINGAFCRLEDAGHHAMAIVKADAVRHDDTRNDDREGRTPRVLLRRSGSLTHARRLRPPLRRVIPEEDVPVLTHSVFRARARCGLGWEVDSS